MNEQLSHSGQSQPLFSASNEVSGQSEPETNKEEHAREVMQVESIAEEIFQQEECETLFDNIMVRSAYTVKHSEIELWYLVDTSFEISEYSR